MTSRSILILTADAGLGHRRSAAAIEAALRERYGERCQVKVINPLDEADAPRLIERLEQGYDGHVTEGSELYRLAYKTLNTPLVSDLAQGLAARMLADVMVQIARRFPIDVLVSTHPTHSHPAVRAFKKEGHPAALAVVITDLTDVPRLWFNPAAEMHFVPTGEVHRQALDHGIAPDRIRRTGLPVHPSFTHSDRSPQELRHSLGWEPDPTTVLVVASRRTRRMADIGRILDRAQLDLQLVLVAGGEQRLTAALREVNWLGPVQVCDWVDDMASFMQASDLIVTKAGGMIVSEALACGLPLILSEALPGQEQGNVRYVVEHNAGAWAPGPAEVLATLHTWLRGDPVLHMNLRASASRLGNPRAAFDIADSLWELAGTP